MERWVRNAQRPPARSQRERRPSRAGCTTSESRETAALATTAEIDAFKNTYRDTQPQKPLHACAYSIHRDVIGRLGHQVWSLTQLHSVGYWQSTFTVNK